MKTHSQLLAKVLADGTDLDKRRAVIHIVEALERCPRV